jgi:hypothetical protein
LQALAACFLKQESSKQSNEKNNVTGETMAHIGFSFQFNISQ